MSQRDSRAFQWPYDVCRLVKIIASTGTTMMHMLYQETGHAACLEMT